MEALKDMFYSCVYIWRLRTIGPERNKDVLLSVDVLFREKAMFLRVLVMEQHLFECEYVSGFLKPKKK